ncbi:hypothetical protein T03_2088 [Trichinella britovi]|uniref:Uncharacterized protein n=1 Tax=Trichinella britovi TaxID=45882 RepID=A0A0V1C4J6_TRIBR|nr:hypothetical protein T03_7888 [Trichinella britovi]KRY44468.1 hypothetical protein T03_2088 [Trichinella britovi]
MANWNFNYVETSANSRSNVVKKQIVTTTTKLHLRITGGGLAFPADVA